MYEVIREEEKVGQKRGVKKIRVRSTGRSQKKKEDENEEIVPRSSRIPKIHKDESEDSGDKKKTTKSDEQIENSGEEDKLIEEETKETKKR